MELPFAESFRIKMVETIRKSTREEREQWIKEAKYNLFNLKSDQVFIDLLTDSGTGAMSDKQWAELMLGDESYAGARSYYKMKNAIKEILGFDYFLPTHQGRAAENVLYSTIIKEGDALPGNSHFDTTKGHIEFRKALAIDCTIDEAADTQLEIPFKGNMDPAKLEAVLKKYPREKIPAVVLTITNNTAGGQPVSMENIREVSALCKKYGVNLQIDSARFAENAYFIKTRETAYSDKSIREIVRTLSDAMDIIYFSARKLGFGRGGAIILNNKKLFEHIKTFVSSFEGFPTFGGMSVKEMEAICVGLDDTMDENIIAQGPQFIEYLCNELEDAGIPVVTPPGGLGCHLDAMKFVPHIARKDYPAGSLAAAIYIASGARGMERGGIDEPWDDADVEPYGAMELVRLAVPRRVYTVSQMNYLIDRICWLYDNRELIGGLKFETEGPHNFYDKLNSVSDWPEKLAAKFRMDFGDSL